MARVLVVIGLLVFLFIGAYSLSAAYEDTVTDANDQITVDNETITIAYNTTNSVGNTSNDNIFNESVEVYQNGTQIQSNGGDNWEWRTGNGQLYVPNGSALDEGDAEITYRYTPPTDEQETVKNIATVPWLFSETLAVVVGFILVMLAIVQLSGRR